MSLRARAWGSLGRDKLDSVSSHLHIALVWRAVNYLNSVPEDDLRFP